MDRTDVRVPCIDCHTPVTFTGQPGDATCPSCRLEVYLTADGHVGRYPAADWNPGNIQGNPRPTT